MNIVKSCGLIASGLAAGMLLVISCSDDHPGSADAATCDCPAAEPPLAGRVQIVKATQEISAGSFGGQSNRCPENSVLLSGGCGTPDGQPAELELQQSRPAMTEDGWACHFRNNATGPVTIQVTAFCLVPAS